MCIEYLDSILEVIARPFDERIQAIGTDLEHGLTTEQSTLVEQLETTHWDRAGELVRKSFGVGVEVGIALGRFFPNEPT